MRAGGSILEIYSDYDLFAWFYNRHWGDEFSNEVVTVFNTLLFPHLEPRSRILDLCCGTGQLAAMLMARGYSVAGIDGSEAMLSLARENAPEADLIRADARSFSIPGMFAAVVCTFDSLNHVLLLAELKRVFGCVRSALDDDGVFLFDLNMEEEFDRKGLRSSFEIIEDDHACSVRSEYDSKTRLKSYEVTMLALEGDEWQRGDLTLLQRYYTAQEIVHCLEECGFDRISIHDAEVEFDISVSEGRVFFVAHKPGPPPIAPEPAIQ